jgi:hypothetical protein
VNSAAFYTLARVGDSYFHAFVGVGIAFNPSLAVPLEFAFALVQRLFSLLLSNLH